MSLLSPLHLAAVLLVFVRVSGLLMAAPFFGQRGIPVPVRVLLGVLLAYCLVGFAGSVPVWALQHPLGFVVAIAIEALTGAVIGFAAQFVFWAVQMTGDIIGFQMGLSMAATLNPLNGHNENPVGKLLSMLFILVFVLLDGHHQLIRGLALSFQAVPLAGAHLDAAGPLMLRWMGMLFETALRLAAPFAVALFLVDVALAIYARTTPQADIFGLNFVLKLAMGLLVLGLVVPQFMPQFPLLIDRATERMTDLIEVLAVGT